jgi:hypothetical protein
LETLLTPAAERTDAERQAIEKAMRTSDVPPPPVRVLPSGPVQLPVLRKTNTISSPALPDEDEVLLKELELELQNGKVDLAHLDQL